MTKNIFKSIGACLAGILVGVILSLGTDKVLETSEILPQGNLWVEPGLIIFVLLYRKIYNFIGSYIVACLAPNHPMRHVLIVGVLGTLASIIGAVTTANMNLGPAWYAWTLAVLSLPSSWLAAWLYLRKR